MRRDQKNQSSVLFENLPHTPQSRSIILDMLEDIQTDDRVEALGSDIRRDRMVEIKYTGPDLRVILEASLEQLKVLGVHFGRTNALASAHSLPQCPVPPDW